jgi:hypothetical protein
MEGHRLIERASRLQLLALILAIDLMVTLVDALSAFLLPVG